MLEVLPILSNAVAANGSLLAKSCYNCTRRVYLSRSLSDAACRTVLYEIFISEARTEKPNRVRMPHISVRKIGFYSVAQEALCPTIYPVSLVIWLVAMSYHVTSSQEPVFVGKKAWFAKTLQGKAQTVTLSSPHTPLYLSSDSRIRKSLAQSIVHIINREIS